MNLYNFTAAVLITACVLGCEHTANTQPQPELTEAPAAATVADSLNLPETNFYEIMTPQGRLVIRLFDETPLHRDNFKKLVAEGMLDSTLFHRVIDGFMIQGGDPYSRDDNPLNDGNGGPGYTLPAELDTDFLHRRGAVAAARQPDTVNPERRSSGSQFYIVDGKPFPDSVLTQIEEMLQQEIPDSSFAFADSARTIYKTEGGAPFLQRQYTVFGKLVEGFEVLDRIAALPTPRSKRQRVHPALTDRPPEPVTMVVRPLPDYQPPPSAKEAMN